MKEKEDLRKIRTRKSIHQAFEEMICEMDYQDITVRELTNRAMINRKTFYLHYNSLDDLLEEFQNDLAQDFILKTNKFRKLFDLKKITREFFLVCESSKLYERLICSKSYQNISKQITENIMNSTWKFENEPNISEEEFKVLMVFVSRSTIEIYRYWIDSKRNIPLEKIIEMTANLVCSGIDQYLN